MRKAAYFAVAALAPMLASAPAWGQSSAPAEVEELLVVGQRASIASSVAAQRDADGVSSVLTRDDVGQFPDQNVAEAVRRAPGVNVLNDQGEGRFVAVRGLDPGLNAASINGETVRASEYREIRNPANRDEVVGLMPLGTTGHLEQAIATLARHGARPQVGVDAALGGPLGRRHQHERRGKVCGLRQRRPAQHQCEKERSHGYPCCRGGFSFLFRHRLQKFQPS